MNPIRDYMSEVIINVTKKELRGDSVGKGLFPKVFSEISIKSLAGELEGDFVRSDRNSFSAWGFVKQLVRGVMLT